MRRTMSTVAATAIILAVLACEGRAGATPVSAEPLSIRQVSLFKNGLAFFTGQITCPSEAASFQVALPVAPCHGTFWVSYPADLAVTSIVAKQTESQQLIDAVNIPEILRANPGRKVQLTIGDKNVTGVIRYMAGNRDAPARSIYVVFPPLPLSRLRTAPTGQPADRRDRRRRTIDRPQDNCAGHIPRRQGRAAFRRRRQVPHAARAVEEARSRRPDGRQLPGQGSRLDPQLQDRHQRRIHGPSLGAGSDRQRRLPVEGRRCAARDRIPAPPIRRRDEPPCSAAEPRPVPAVAVRADDPNPGEST